MKERYTISIADIQINILSDEPEECVHSTVAQLDELVRDLTVKNKRCSKLDAALLCALDSLSEKNKNDKRIKNLEAQISLYEATIRRLRQDIARMQEESASKPQHPLKEILREDAAALAKENKAAETKAPKEHTPEQLPLDPPAASPAPEAEATAGDKPALHDAKLRQIEELLRRRSEGGSADATPEENSRNAKLREIEELLRKNGSGQSLSEALHDAKRT